MASITSSVALSLALVASMAGQTYPPGTPDAYQGPPVGAVALHDGSTWVQPGAHWGSAVSDSPAATPADPRNDYPGYYADGCHAPRTATNVPAGCVYGDPSSAQTWMLVGSSKSGSYGDALISLAEREGAALRVATQSTNPFAPGSGSGAARAFNDAVLAEITRVGPEVVFLAASPSAAFSYDVGPVVERALAAGAGHVALLWDPGMADKPELNEAAEQVAEQDGRVSWVDVSDWVHPGGTDPAAIGGVTVAGAGSHLTATYALTLTNPLASELHEAGLVDGDPDVVMRVAGRDRYETAALLSTTNWGAHAGDLYVASGTDFPDALAAGALSGDRDRLLLTRLSRLPVVTATALAALVAPEYTRIVIAGGQLAVSGAVEVALGGHAPTVRLAGKDRYETAAVLARDALDGQQVDTVFLASGENYPDALAAASHAGPDDALLLTKPGTLPLATRAALTDLDARLVVLVGGTGAVSADVEDQVRGLGFTVERAAGVDRYETAAALFAHSGVDTGTVLVATGRDFPDALAAGQVGPVVLTRTTSLPIASRGIIRAIDPQTVTIVGGQSVVTGAVESQLQDVMAD